MKNICVKKLLLLLIVAAISAGTIADAADLITNPFSQPFNQLLEELRNKQMFENLMIRNFFANFQTYMPDVDDDPQLKEALDYLRTSSIQRQADLDAKVRENLKQVKYQIIVNLIK